MDSPLVLSMCDTLLQRSEESGDKHMQIMRGTGLGLPICRLLAEKFGGSLVIDADYTQRCCFVLRLPWVHKEVSDHRLHGFTHI